MAINFTQNPVANHGISRIRKRNAINLREFSGPTVYVHSGEEQISKDAIERVFEDFTKK